MRSCAVWILSRRGTAQDEALELVHLAVAAGKTALVGAPKKNLALHFSSNLGSGCSPTEDIQAQ